MSKDLDPREVAINLINGMSFSQVPEFMHQSLLVPLTVLKNEAKIAGKFAIAERVDEIVSKLTLSAIPPDNDFIDENALKSSPSYVTRDITFSEDIPIMEALKTQDESDIAKIRIAKSDYRIAVNYWENEWIRFQELKENAYKELISKSNDPEFPSLQRKFEREWLLFEDKFKNDKNKELKKLKAKIVKLGGTVTQ